MQRHQILKSSFNRALIAGSLAACMSVAATGCEDPAHPSSPAGKEAALITQLQQRYPENARLREILGQQYARGPEPLEYFAAHHIDLQLSADGLPKGAIIRIYKDHWQINPFAPVGMQAATLYDTIEYVQNQERDGVPFGVGESFSFEGGEITPIGTAPVIQPKP